MLAFSAFIYRLTGNPFMWTMQNAAWGRVYRSLDSIVSDRAGYIAANGLYSYASTQTLDLFYSLAIVLALAAVWPVYRRFGLPFAAFILLTIVPPMSAGGLLSMGRVTSVLFPVFLAGRRRTGPSPRGVGLFVWRAAGICRRDVFHMAAVISGGRLITNVRGPQIYSTEMVVAFFSSRLPLS